jgi:uncharacterized protein
MHSVSFGIFLVLGSLITVSSLARGEDAPKPSFPCEKAKTLDEKTICSDARLAELDRLQAAAYLLVKQKNGSEAIKEARTRLEERSLCGNDRVCLFDSMSFAEGIVMPAWADAYRKELIQDVLKDDLSLKSYALVGKRASFPISAKGVQATLIEIDGVDTDHASAKGQITQADFLEVCERDPGGETIQYGGKLTVRQCAQGEQTNTRERTFVSHANCKAKELNLWDGSWRFAGYQDETITWIDPKGETEKPWNGTAAADGHFDLLCPNTLARVRAEAQEPNKDLNQERK